MVATWRNMTICEYCCCHYLRKSFINMSLPVLRTTAGYISESQREFLDRTGQGKLQTIVEKISGKFWLRIKCRTPALWKHTSHDVLFSLLFYDSGWSTQTVKMSSASEMSLKYCTLSIQHGQEKKIEAHSEVRI